jgi:hypothetical protein
MRLSVSFILISAILCEARGQLLKLHSVPPSIEKVSPEFPNALGLLLRNQYIRALALVDTIYGQPTLHCLSSSLCYFYLYLLFVHEYGSTDKAPQRQRRMAVRSHDLRISS